MTRPRGLVATLLALTLLSPVSARPPQWERHAFSLPESIWSVEAIDVNADGRRDLIGMGVTKVFALTAPAWPVHTVLDIKEGKMLYCVALDADQDGDVDLAIGRYQIPWIEFRQARAAGKTAPEPTGPDFSVAWLENVGRVSAPLPLHVVDTELNGIHGVWAGDVDGDGRVDLIADSISGPTFPNSIVWFQAPPPGQTSFPRHVVTRNGADGRPHYLDFGDVDGDGRGDVLLGDSGRGTFTWWKRGRAGDLWAKHVVATEKGATNIKLADVNHDGKPDVVGSCGHGVGVFWYEAPDWRKHPIDDSLATPHALAVADFDGDGDLDVAVASYTAFVVRWYENDGRGGFAAHDIETRNQQQAYDMKAIDVDGDGRVDLVLAGRESRNVLWYRNR